MGVELRKKLQTRWITQRDDRASLVARFCETPSEYFERVSSLTAQRAISREVAEDVVFFDMYTTLRKETIDEQLRQQVDRVCNTSRERHVLTECLAGGERFAGLLTCVAGECFDTPERDVRRQAVVTECLLNGFLIVDDLLDRHVERRGTSTIWQTARREHGLDVPAASGVAAVYQNKLLQGALRRAEDGEIKPLADAIGAAGTGAIAEATQRHGQGGRFDHANWREFSTAVSSGLRPAVILPALASPTAVDSDAIESVARSFGLFEQTVDNAVDEQLPEDMDPETAIRRQARKTVRAFREIEAGSDVFERFVPWFFYRYFETHANPTLRPELLYQTELGIYS